MGDRVDSQRLAFIARAADELNRSLDYQETLAAVARLAVPALADWCLIDLLEDGRLARVTVVAADPRKLEQANEMERRYPPRADDPSGPAAVIRSGAPTLHSQLDLAGAFPYAHDDEHRRLIRALGLRSYLCAPLRRGATTIGAITLLTGESGRVLTQDDLAVVMTLADRAAVAIENARLFHQVEQLQARTAAELDRLHQLVNEAPIGIALLRGPEHRFEIVNDRFAQVLGDFFEAHALLGRPLVALDHPWPAADAVQRVWETGETLIHDEVSVGGDGSGELRYCKCTLTPLREPGGNIDAVLVFAVDITEQVQTRRKTDEAREVAEQASRSKDEFLAMLGHELRNPLAPILTALHLMELRAPDVFQRERTVIERQVKHVVRLVDDLLDVSRITRGRIELHRTKVELADVVAKGIEMASPMLEERDHDLHLEVPRGLVVDGDATRLAQVVANLLTNAAKYTERGGRIDLVGERTAGKVTLRVRDTGIGIAPEMLPRVFDMFVQERQALDRSRGGLGLGLAIVRSLVHLHGGEVAATSEGPGKGSEFVVTLPALERPAAGARAKVAPPPATPARRTERVLVVDDNPDALEMLADALELRGYTTARAIDGPSALEVAQRVHPQIALLDIGLPVMDGYELARRLRELDSNVKLVAVTGYGHPSAVSRSREAGFSAHLVKPITIETVQSTIDRLSTGEPAAETSPSR